MSIQVQIPDLDELRRKLDSAPEMFDYALKIVLKRAGLRLRREAREIMPGEIFDRAITDQSGESALSRIVGTAPEVNLKAARSIVAGRPAGHPPSLKATQRWIRTYGLAGAVSLKTQRQVQKKNVRQRDVEGLAWVIQQRIRASGTKPIPFISGAIGPSMADIRRYFDEAAAAALKKIARGA